MNELTGAVQTAVLEDMALIKRIVGGRACGLVCGVHFRIRDTGTMVLWELRANDIIHDERILSLDIVQRLGFHHRPTDRPRRWALLRAFPSPSPSPLLVPLCSLLGRNGCLRALPSRSTPVSVSRYVLLGSH